jgi:signal transduction histidine kinase
MMGARRRLARKYVVALVALVTGALLASGVVQLYASYNESKAALVALQGEKARAAASRIETFVKEIERQLGWTTHPVASPAALDQRRQDSYRLQRQVQPITELSHLDSMGREQLRISRLAMEVVGSQADYSQDPRFLEAKKGRTYFGPVYFRKDSEPYMSIAMPQSGGGVTVAEINLKFILDVISQIKIGKAGLAYTVDRNGVLIAHPDISVVLQKTSLANLEQVKAALTPGHEPVTIARDPKGREVLSAYSTIGPLGWVVFVEQPLEEAFEPLRASARSTGILVVAGIVLSVVVSAFLGRRMARPIQVLQESAAKIGAGDLSHRIDLRSGDELETLADEFNQMTGRLRESYATLEQKVDDRTRELSESLEQQTATAEILRVISSSPTDVQPVFDSIAAKALDLCRATTGWVYRFDGELIHIAAAHSLRPEAVDVVRQSYPMPPSRDGATPRAVLSRTVVYVPDIREDHEYRLDALAQAAAYLSVLAVPMLLDGKPIGVLTVTGAEAGAFSPRQIALLQTFADQAVIAIENVRLFRELEEKNRTITEALEQQTATAGILRVISSSPTDVQPVFATVLSSAVRLCGAQFGGVFRFEDGLVHFVTSHQWPPPQLEVVRQRFPMPPGNGSLAARAIRDRQVVQTADYMAEPGVQVRWVGDNPERPRGTIAVPMLRESVPLGCIVLARGEPGLFSDEHVALLQTFADQAVIAIENVRLFKELEEKNRTITEALEQQTATAEILRVISSSPTDVQPVLAAVAENAARVCGAADAIIMRVEPSGDLMRRVAHFGSVPLILPEVRPLNRHSTAGRAILDRGPVHIDDAISPEGAREFPETASSQIRTNLAVPLLREGVAIGAIAMRRLEVQPFTDKQIALLQTFADQAVIAIENVRLFRELEEKNRTITEALEQQTATAEILRVISASPTDVQPVLDAVAENAAHVCGATDAIILRVESDGTTLRRVAHFGELPPTLPEVRPLNRQSISGRAILEGRPLHVEDMHAPEAAREYSMHAGPAGPDRTILAMPLMREGTAIGAIDIRRTEVRPFSEKQITLLQTFADQAVIAIENVRLFTELQSRTAELTRSVGELQALGDVSRAISSTLDLEVVLATIVARANQLAETDGGAIYEFDAATRAFRLWATDRFPDDFVAALRATTLVYGEGAVGRAAATRAPVQVADVGDTQAYESRIRDALLRFGYRSLLAVPLVSEDEVVGALVVNRRVAGEFPPRIVELLSTFATQSALAILNARLFSEIEDKSRELEVANQHKSEFLASVSHELRTPLNAIIGFSEVMLERLFGEVNEKQEEYLNDILSSGRHLLSLINDILDLAKIEAGRMELEAGDFDLPQAIDNTLVLVRERALRRGITVERVVDPRLGEINGDERKIKQVLLNLLSNAVKFTPEGGRIEVRAEAANGTAEISVADTGVGIAPEDHEAVFEEFRQVGTDYARKHEGTGLGLALARKFVELHGGRIWVKSQVGQGSTFTFTIPISRGHHGG